MMNETKFFIYIFLVVKVCLALNEDGGKKEKSASLTRAMDWKILRAEKNPQQTTFIRAIHFNWLARSIDRLRMELVIYDRETRQLDQYFKLIKPKTFFFQANTLLILVSLFIFIFFIKK